MKKIIAIISALIMMLSSVVAVNAAGTKGDVNKDGKVNSTDALEVLQYVVKTKTELADMDAADMDADGNINTTDALKILQAAVGIVDPAEPSGLKMPTSIEETIDLYNTAVNKIVSEKAGYKKNRTTNLVKITGADAIMKISAAKEAIYEFLGVGSTEYTNTKGTAKYLNKSTLELSDVAQVTVVAEGSDFIVTLKLRDGSSTMPTKTDTSPLKKCGLTYGPDLNSEYDYKNAECIYGGVKQVGSVDSIAINTMDTVIVLKVDATNGKAKSLEINYNWTADIKNLKYTIIKISANGQASTSVKLSNFDW